MLAIKHSAYKDIVTHVRVMQHGYMSVRFVLVMSELCFAHAVKETLRNYVGI